MPLVVAFVTALGMDASRAGAQVPVSAKVGIDGLIVEVVDLGRAPPVRSRSAILTDARVAAPNVRS